jgi:O-acetyl-ADP-ribose deacetylase (regulator of RNase III)
MIEYRHGNLFAADVEALVNSVNTVGVMGKGIALQFKKQFPEVFRIYARACKKDEVEIGKMFTVPVGTLNPKYIINFPTKKHWRENSRIEYIEEGLKDLVAEIERLDIASIAIPPLGCGVGGLDWSEVRPLIEEALSRVPQTQALLYEPGYVPNPSEVRAKGDKPKLTPARAIMVKLIDLYSIARYRLGRLEAEKLAYFVQTAGETELNLNFQEGRFGPYADELNFLLQKLEGYYTVGYGDRTGKSLIELLPGAKDEAEDYLRSYPESQEHIERVARLIEGFETPYGMELLATVHWAASNKGATSPEEALRIVQEWTPRKGDLFNEEHVEIAWERLEEEGWMNAKRIVYH